MCRGDFQEVVEFEEIVLAQMVLETFFGLAHFFLEVFFMAPEGREAGAVILAEGRKGGVTGQKGVVDVVTLGMIADGAFGHGGLR